MNHIPQGPENNNRVILNIFENSQVKVHPTGINDTGGKMMVPAGVVDTGGNFATGGK
jgi:hypothetical protein